MRIEFKIMKEKIALMATKLRERTNHLEQKIKSLIDEFHIEVGDCSPGSPVR